MHSKPQPGGGVLHKSTPPPSRGDQGLQHRARAAQPHREGLCSLALRLQHQNPQSGPRRSWTGGHTVATVPERSCPAWPAQQHRLMQYRMRHQWSQDGAPCSRLRPPTVPWPLKTAIWGLLGRGHSPGYMGLAATTQVPMGAQILLLSLNDYSRPSTAGTQGFQKSLFFLQFFCRRMPA